jgi:DNA primase
MIASKTIESVKALSIKDVTALYVDLKNVGSNFKGLCPLHSEKTPSFTISILHNNYKCFGCGEGGDAIDLVRKIERCDFTEAVRIISDKFAIDYVEVETDEYKRLKVYSNAIETVYKGNKPSQEQIKLLHEINLCNKYGFLLKNRKLFAIKDENGLYRGLSGRRLNDNDKSPKYINSPQSEIYNKSQLLYNLYEAKQEIRKQNQCFLCEGFTDVDTLKNSGVLNVVANCGTAFTSEQANLIKRYCDVVVIFFDGDKAGLTATYKALDIALKVGLQVQAIFLQDNEDPKDYLTSGKHLKDLKPIDLLIQKSNLTATIIDLQLKQQKIKSIVASLNCIKSPIYLDMYVVKICEILDLRHETVYTEISTLKAKTDVVKQAITPSNDSETIIPKPTNKLRQMHKDILVNDYFKKLENHIEAINKMTQPSEIFKSLGLHLDMKKRHKFLSK